MPKGPPPFDKTAFSEITPLLDGSAYAKSDDSRLWYLRGSQAVRVESVSGASQKLPAFSEITPLLEGDAYATTDTGKEPDSGIWYLHAERAERVSEVPSLAESGPRAKVSAKTFYALYLSERKKRKAAEYRAENPGEFAEPPDWVPDGIPY